MCKVMYLAASHVQVFRDSRYGPNNTAGASSNRTILLLHNINRIEGWFKYGLVQGDTLCLRNQLRSPGRVRWDTDPQRHTVSLDTGLPYRQFLVGEGF